MKSIGVTETYDPAFVNDWDLKLKDANIIITKSLTDQMITKLLDNSDKCILHITCTGLGGSIYEPNVPNYRITKSRVAELIYRGFNINNIVLRTDPIIPNQYCMEQFNKVIESFRDLSDYYNHKFTCRLSIIDMYPHVIERFNSAGIELPFEGFHAPRNIMEAFNKYFNGWHNGPHFELVSCGESGLNKSIVTPTACVSIDDIILLNQNPSDYSSESNGTRSLCGCIKKVNILGVKPSRCPHQCIYCYWKDSTV